MIGLCFFIVFWYVTRSYWLWLSAYIRLYNSEIWRKDPNRLLWLIYSTFRICVSKHLYCNFTFNLWTLLFKSTFCLRLWHSLTSSQLFVFNLFWLNTTASLDCWWVTQKTIVTFMLLFLVLEFRFILMGEKSVAAIKYNLRVSL